MRYAWSLMVLSSIGFTSCGMSEAGHSGHSSGVKQEQPERPKPLDLGKNAPSEVASKVGENV